MRSGIHSRISVLMASLMRKECAEWGFLGGLKAHLRGLGSEAPQKIFRGMISSPMLAETQITKLNHLTTTKQTLKTKPNKSKTQKTTQPKIKTTNPILKTKQIQTTQLNIQEKI